MEHDSIVPGTAVARPASMLRRILAMLTMVVLIGLLLVLIWRVYLHHEYARPAPDSSVVGVAHRAA